MIMIMIMLLILILYFWYKLNKETFLDNSIYTGRHTRNMSYDLRGEAYYPPINSALRFPFNNSEIYF